MGALTTNSDLKNDYTNVKVYTPDSRKKTGLKKVGCFMGDFVKTSIGTLINTGSSIGPCSMLVHMGGLTPFHIPPFSWYINGAVYKTILLEDFLATAREVMSRRGFNFTDTFVSFITGIHALREPVGGEAMNRRVELSIILAVLISFFPAPRPPGLVDRAPGG